jgi:hypothetical protein
VSVDSFVIVLCLVAAVLAVWIVARWPKVGPKSLPPGLLHVMLAVLVGAVTAPAIRAFASLGLPGTILVVTLGIALPALTYMFLATVWLLRVMRDHLL